MEFTITVCSAAEFFQPVAHVISCGLPSGTSKSLNMHPFSEFGMLSRSGCRSIGASTALTLDESVRRVQEIADAAREVHPDVLILTHGGPIAMPEDAEYVLKRVTGAHSLEHMLRS